jgi:hypothetical protein
MTRLFYDTISLSLFFHFQTTHTMTLRRPAPGVSLTEEEAAAAERHSARLFRNQFRGEDAVSIK